MSNLETLKAQHPEWCFDCGNRWLTADDVAHHAAEGLCPENPIVAALVAATLGTAAPALAADAQAPSQAATTSVAPAPKRVTARHYWTLEKMLRRFSRQAGEARTRG